MSASSSGSTTDVVTAAVRRKARRSLSAGIGLVAGTLIASLLPVLPAEPAVHVRLVQVPATSEATP